MDTTMMDTNMKTTTIYCYYGGYDGYYYGDYYYYRDYYNEDCY